MTEENKHNKKRERLGFSYERGGVHTARTMMLAELSALLSFVDVADATRADYLEAIQFLSDCTHMLAVQAVPMAEFPSNCQI